MLERLTRSFSDIFRRVSGNSVITEKNIEEAVESIKVALLEADVNLRVVRRFVNAVAEEAKGEAVLRSVRPGEQFVKIVHDRLVALLGGDTQDLLLKGPDTLSVVLLLGLQGSGKTTSAAKLAHRLKKQGRKPMLAACDLVRPAAAEQLTVLGNQVGVPVHRIEGEKDPVKVVKSALDAAKKAGLDTLIVDTAGRLQVDEELMAELVRVRDAAKPDAALLVADSMTGQSAVDIAKAFSERIGITGVVLTKFDSDARGGAALSLKSVAGVPLTFVGVGEKVEDLELFHPDRVAGRILGMGDVVSLVEKAQEVVNQEEAEALQRKIEKEGFTLEDWLDQLRKVKKMGSVKSMLDMVPGLSGQVREEDINLGKLKVQEAILSSMTKKERANHLIIGPSRRGRIARGSGTSVAEVARLLKEFEKTRSMMKKMAKFGKNPKAAEALMGRMGGGGSRQPF